MLLSERGNMGAQQLLFEEKSPAQPEDGGERCPCGIREPAGGHLLFPLTEAAWTVAGLQRNPEVSRADLGCLPTFLAHPPLSARALLVQAQPAPAPGPGVKAAIAYRHLLCARPRQRAVFSSIGRRLAAPISQRRPGEVSTVHSHTAGRWGSWDSNQAVWLWPSP